MRSSLLIGLAALLLAAAPEDGTVAQEHEKFAGRWVLHSGEMDGKALAKEHVEKSELTYTGDRCVLKTPHQSPEPIKSKLVIDATKAPKQMKFLRSAGPNAGKVILAIYEFVDDDTYRICFDPSGKARPKMFDTEPGSGHILHVWKRPKD